MACKAIWSGSCYTAPKEADFYHFTPSDEAGFEWVVLKDLARHCYARAGDHFVTPFQCNLCIFCTLMQCNPASQDTLLILCIRQVNLDTLWGHETAMVNSTKCSIDKLLNLWSTLGISPHLPVLEPHPLKDTFGYAVAIAMVLKSRDCGHYVSYQQYNTIRNLQSGYTKVYRVSLAGCQDHHTIGGNSPKVFLSQYPIHSTWFERFSHGCLSWMGQEIHQDTAISLPVMHALLADLEQEGAATNQPIEHQHLASMLHCLLWVLLRPRGIFD